MYKLTGFLNREI